MDELLVNSLFSTSKQVFALNYRCSYDLLLLNQNRIPENSPIVVNDFKFLFKFLFSLHSGKAKQKKINVGIHFHMNLHMMLAISVLSNQLPRRLLYHKIQ